MAEAQQRNDFEIERCFALKTGGFGGVGYESESRTGGVFDLMTKTRIDEVLGLWKCHSQG